MEPGFLLTWKTKCQEKEWLALVFSSFCCSTLKTSAAVSHTHTSEHFSFLAGNRDPLTTPIRE